MIVGAAMGSALLRAGRARMVWIGWWRHSCADLGDAERGGDRRDVFVVGAAATADDAQVDPAPQLGVELGQLVDVTAVEFGRGVELAVAQPGGVGADALDAR